jgi:hypothetical protein
MLSFGEVCLFFNSCRMQVSHLKTGVRLRDALSVISLPHRGHTRVCLRNCWILSSFNGTLLALQTLQLCLHHSMTDLLPK